MIVYKKGDILKSAEQEIAHGVNCSGGFGSGIAGQIATLYPEVKEEYLEKYHSFKSWSLGDVQLVVSKGLTFFNLATQVNYGPADKGPYIDYVGLRRALQQLFTFYGFPDGIAMPKIGAGLAGGNWDIISKIINEESGDVEVRVYEL